MIPPQKREQKHNYFSFNMACAENFAYLRETGNDIMVFFLLTSNTEGAGIPTHYLMCFGKHWTT